MPIVWRRILFTIFLLGFAVAAPSVVLYTAGYRLDFENIRLIRTGGIVIKSQPRQMTVTLNTETQQITSPWRNDRLVPQNYHITLSRDGYFPWHKTLAVYSQRTTFIEDVILFPVWANNRLPIAPAPQMVVAHDQNVVAFATIQASSSMVMIAESGRDQAVTQNLPGQLRSMTWSAHGERLLLHTTNTTTPWWIWDRLANNWNSLDDPLLRASDDLFWHDNDDFTLAGRTSTTTVRSYHLALKSTVDYALTATTSADYLLGNDGLYILWNTKNQSHVTRVDAMGDNTTIASWPLHQGYDLTAIHRDFLYIRDQSNLHAINLKQPQNPARTYNFHHVVIDDRFGDLLWNDHELYTLDPHSQQTSFLARFGDRITDVTWHSSGRYVIVAFNRAVALVELDARDRRNIHRYELPEPLTQLTYWSRDQVLLFTTTLNTTTSIWRQPLVLD